MNCWQCGKQLVAITSGPRRGEIVIETVRDPLGHEHKVHKTCKADAERQFRSVTAAEMSAEGGRHWDYISGTWKGLPE